MVQSFWQDQSIASCAQAYWECGCPTGNAASAWCSKMYFCMQIKACMLILVTDTTIYELCSLPSMMQTSCVIKHCRHSFVSLRQIHDALCPLLPCITTLHTWSTAGSFKIAWQHPCCLIQLPCMPKLVVTAAAAVPISAECWLLGLMEHWTHILPPFVIALVHILTVKCSVQ